jgi:serine/threonine protein kinase
MKTVFFCEICQRTFILDEGILHKCDICQNELMIQSKEVRLRCKNCGLSQDIQVFFINPKETALICQNSKCNGTITIVEASAPSQIIGDTIPAPIEANTEKISSEEISRLNEATTKIENYIPKEVQLPFLGRIHYRKETLGIKPGDILEIGKNEYQIICQIGTGGMGAVHQAIDYKTQKIVAVKEFYYSRYQDPDTGENKCEDYWDRESKLTQLQGDAPHPCLQFVGALKLEYIQNNEYYIILNYIEGKTLEKWYLDRYQTLTDLTILEIRMIIKNILLPLCRHLQYVHEKRIIHRDISPQNIMIQEQQGVFIPILIDWGVATLVGPEIDMYNPQSDYFENNEPGCTGITNRGTPPEVLGGYNPVASTDVYMLGHLIYYILTGGHYSSVACEKTEFVLHPQDLNPDIPSVLNKLVEYMTQYEPSHRLKSMKAVEEALIHIYNKTAMLETEKDSKIKYSLYCENNRASIPIPEKKILKIGRDEIIACGKDEENDNELYNALLSTDKGLCHFELYLDKDVLFIKDLHSKTGTFLENVTTQTLHTIPLLNIKGKQNCFIPLIEENIDQTAILIPYKSDKMECQIRFFIQKEYSEEN